MKKKLGVTYTLPHKFHTFYYHNDGADNNGNNGPSPVDLGWIVAIGKDGDEAVAHLPKRARDKVRAYMQKNGYTTIQDCMEETCGWNVGFSFLHQEDWDQACLNYAEEYGDE